MQYRRASDSLEAAQYLLSIPVLVSEEYLRNIPWTYQILLARDECKALHSNYVSTSELEAGNLSL
jgi:hypothetical protein